MDHIKAIGIKFIIVSVVVFSIFAIFYNVSIGNLVWMSLLVTVATYLIGDLYMLPRLNNLVTTIADFGLSFVLLWVLGLMLIEVSIPIALASLFAAFFITVTDPLFHTYMIERVLDEEKAKPRRRETREFGSFQTEFAEENKTEAFHHQQKNKNEDKQK
ncbi:YndM family protein [Oceanobacillus halotolerans]|uniref:YndM family protein n=1 Tax=Oceanobacillus halotolerans TaxID=2663380 RepID=UPI0013D97C49|nr:YndM family protein [Oceanobacillus halotolerans]